MQTGMRNRKTTLHEFKQNCKMRSISWRTIAESNPSSWPPENSVQQEHFSNQVKLRHSTYLVLFPGSVRSCTTGYMVLSASAYTWQLRNIFMYSHFNHQSAMGSHHTSCWACWLPKACALGWKGGQQEYCSARIWSRERRGWIPHAAFDTLCSPGAPLQECAVSNTSGAIRSLLQHFLDEQHSAEACKLYRASSVR